MSTALIVGKKGGGKSAYGMSLIEKFLLDPNEKRPIVTNLNIRWNKLADRIHKKGGSTAGRLFCRSTQHAQAPLEWMRQFWRDRGDDILLLDILQEEHTGYKTVQLSPCCQPRHGVIYIIDETSHAFRARDFQSFSFEAEWYMRTERHLGDDVFLLTQHEDLIDVTFARLFNEVRRVANMSSVQLWGFKGPPRILVRTYPTLEVGPMLMLRWETIRIGPGLLDCYRTNALGGGRTKATSGTFSKGMPMWAGISVLVVVMGGWPFCVWVMARVYAKRAVEKTIGMGYLAKGRQQPGNEALEGGKPAFSMETGRAQVLAAYAPSRLTMPVVASTPPLATPMREKTLSVTVSRSSVESDNQSKRVESAPIAKILWFWGGEGRVFVRTQQGVCQVEGNINGDRFFALGKIWRVGKDWPYECE